MRIGLLATGDELIAGDAMNTTGHAMAQALTSEGLMPGLHVACGDNEKEIMTCLDFLEKRHDIILITGGLGPTSDDRTRFALARFLNIDLVMHQAAFDHINNRLKNAHLQMNEGNQRQALFPATACLFPNPHGTAMGCSYFHKNKHYILLPGPPKECLPMFDKYALPYLLQKVNLLSQPLLKWRLFGVAEGEIAQKLDDALVKIDCVTGYRWEIPYVEFKVRCDASQIQIIKEIVNPLVESHIIASPEEKASERLRNKIHQLKEPFVIIDNATGGLLQCLLQKPDTVHNLSFHERSAVKLRFQITGLSDYWREQDDGHSSEITIKYFNETQCGSETHVISCRRSLAVEYAAEWLCFRLFHLIDQLH